MATAPPEIRAQLATTREELASSLQELLDAGRLKRQLKRAATTRLHAVAHAGRARSRALVSRGLHRDAPRHADGPGAVRAHSALPTAFLAPLAALQSNKAAKSLYKPLSMGISVLGGVVAGAVFKQLWRVVSSEEDAPKATDPDHGWTEVLGAAALEGAVFGLVKAALNRASARGLSRLTGTSPPD